MHGTKAKRSFREENVCFSSFPPTATTLVARPGRFCKINRPAAHRCLHGRGPGPAPAPLPGPCPRGPTVQARGRSHGTRPHSQRGSGAHLTHGAWRASSPLFQTARPRRRGSPRPSQLPRTRRQGCRTQKRRHSVNLPLRLHILMDLLTSSNAHSPFVSRTQDQSSPGSENVPFPPVTLASPQGTVGATTLLLGPPVPNSL